MHNDLPAVPDWLQNAIKDRSLQVVGFGGQTNCFRLVSVIQKKTELTIQDVVSALNYCTQKTTPELEHIGISQSEALLPRVALVLAVMRKLSLDQFKFYDSNGNCGGVLASEEFWKE